MPYTDNLVCTMGFTMLESTYAQYFGNVNAEPVVIRTAFVLMGVFNVVGKLITGNKMDNHKKNPVICSCVGNLLMLLAYITLASLPCLHISQNAQQWVLLATSPPLTLGFVLIFISSLARFHQTELSYSYGLETSAISSGYIKTN